MVHAAAGRTSRRDSFADEILGKSMFELLTEEDSDKARTAFKKAAADSKPIDDFVCWWKQRFRSAQPIPAWVVNPGSWCWTFLQALIRMCCVLPPGWCSRVGFW